MATNIAPITVFAPSKKPKPKTITVKPVKKRGASMLPSDDENVKKAKRPATILSR